MNNYYYAALSIFLLLFSLTAFSLPEADALMASVLPGLSPEKARAQFPELLEGVHPVGDVTQGAAGVQKDDGTALKYDVQSLKQAKPKPLPITPPDTNMQQQGMKDAKAVVPSTLYQSAPLKQGGQDVDYTSGFSESIPVTTTDFSTAVAALSTVAQFDKNKSTNTPHQPIAFPGEVAACRKTLPSMRRIHCCEVPLSRKALKICSQAEIKLAENRMQGQAHKVGSYCAHRAEGGIGSLCIEHKQVFCVFDSVLALTIQTYAKKHLNHQDSELTADVTWPLYGAVHPVETPFGRLQPPSVVPGDALQAVRVWFTDSAGQLAFDLPIGTALTTVVLRQSPHLELSGVCHSLTGFCEAHLTQQPSGSATTWGTARDPHCEGLSLAEVSQLDFGAMDLSAMPINPQPIKSPLIAINPSATHRGST